MITVPHFVRHPGQGVRAATRGLMSSAIGLLMHNANRVGRNHTWYRLKERLCHKYGVRDGCDAQVIPAQPCWECDGKGYKPKITRTLFGEHNDAVKCWECNGSGNYRGVRYVKLLRWKVGAHAFHKPDLAVAYESELAYWKPKARIERLIIHKRTRYTQISLVLLFLVFDTRYFYRRVRDLFFLGAHLRWRIRRRQWARAIKTRFKVLRTHVLGQQPLPAIDDDLPF